MMLGTIVDDILDGPSALGAISGDRFIIDGVEYYDDKVSETYADAICGSIGIKGKHGL